MATSYGDIPAEVARPKKKGRTRRAIPKGQGIRGPRGEGRFEMRRPAGRPKFTGTRAVHEAGMARERPRAKVEGGATTPPTRAERLGAKAVARAQARFKVKREAATRAQEKGKAAKAARASGRAAKKAARAARTIGGARRYAGGIVAGAAYGAIESAATGKPVSAGVSGGAATGAIATWLARPYRETVSKFREAGKALQKSGRVMRGARQTWRFASAGTKLAARTAVGGAGIASAGLAAYDVGRLGYHGYKARKAAKHLATQARGAKRYGVTTTRKKVLGSHMLRGLLTGDPGIKVKLPEKPTKAMPGAKPPKRRRLGRP